MHSRPHIAPTLDWSQRVLPVMIRSLHIGTLTRDTLWKSATLRLSDDSVSHGLANAIEMLTILSGGPTVLVPVPLHDGYVCIFGENAVSKSRIMETPTGFAVRVFQPHYSQTFEDFDVAYRFALMASR